LIAGGLLLAASPGLSVAQRLVGKRRPDTSLIRYGLAALGLMGATLQAAAPAAAQQADKSAYPFFQPTRATHSCGSWPLTDRMRPKVRSRSLRGMGSFLPGSPDVFDHLP